MISQSSVKAVSVIEGQLHPRKPRIGRACESFELSRVRSRNRSKIIVFDGSASFKLLKRIGALAWNILKNEENIEHEPRKSGHHR